MTIELRTATLEQPIVGATRYEPNAGRGLTVEQKLSALREVMPGLDAVPGYQPGQLRWNTIGSVGVRVCGGFQDLPSAAGRDALIDAAFECITTLKSDKLPELGFLATGLGSPERSHFAWKDDHWVCIRGMFPKQWEAAKAAEQAAAGAAQKLHEGVAPTQASGAARVATMAGKPTASASVIAAMSGQLEAPKRYIVQVDDSDKDGRNVYYKAVTNPRPGETIYRGTFAPYQVESGPYGEHSETRYRPVGEIHAEKFRGTPGKDVEVF